MQFWSEDHYRINRSLDNLTVLIPCYLVERLSADGNNLTITLRPNSEQQTPFLRQGSRPRPPWSDDENEGRGNPDFS